MNRTRLPLAAASRKTTLACRRRLAALLALGALCLAAPAIAGNIFFGLTREADKLVLVNHGDSTAFHPVVLRPLADGRWEELPRPPGAQRPTALVAGDRLELQWPGAAGSPALFEAAAPLMVRFFDQAGAGFGQISFFNQPPPAFTPLEAAYVDGRLQITPPPPAAEIRASWLLWPQEEGIAPLRSPVNFAPVQPPARRIEWGPGMETLRLDLGAGRPAATLLHETARGLELQMLPNGHTEARQQRGAWLRAGSVFYRAAWAALAAALIILFAHALRRRELKAFP